jgi:DNA-binding PadR family transcriptional regulator
MVMRDSTAMDACEFLSPSDVLDLAVLGVASERPRTAAEVIGTVKRVGGARFQPTADVVAGRIGALAEAGLLTTAPDGTPAGTSGEARWRPSASGRAHVQRLLMTQSVPPADALAALCACLKICFLEMLEPEARDAVIVDLMAAHRRALDQAQAALAGCPCRCAFVQRYLARDVERWESELIWLEALGARSRARARGAAERGGTMAGQRGRYGQNAADLNVAEQFVLWALRTRLEGAAKLDRLEEGFRLASDSASGSAARAAFEPWFDVLATHCWRDIYVHRTPVRA